MVNLVTIASARTLKLTLAVVGLAGLLGAFVDHRDFAFNGFDQR